MGGGLGLLHIGGVGFLWVIAGAEGEETFSLAVQQHWLLVHVVQAGFSTRSMILGIAVGGGGHL